jgi:hypothetical protein
MAEVLVIDCDECVMQHSAACDDCVVTALCERTPHGAVVFDSHEAQVVQLLSTAGLVPALRHRQRR